MSHSVEWGQNWGQGGDGRHTGLEVLMWTEQAWGVRAMRQMLGQVSWNGMGHVRPRLGAGSEGALVDSPGNDQAGHPYIKE